MKTCIIPHTRKHVHFLLIKWRKIGCVNYKDEQRDNAIYDNEMVYFLFLDGITKTKPYFDIYTLFTYFLFNEIEKKSFSFYRDVKLPPINEKRCNLVMQFFQHVTRNVQCFFWMQRGIFCIFVYIFSEIIRYENLFPGLLHLNVSSYISDELI